MIESLAALSGSTSPAFPNSTLFLLMTFLLSALVIFYFFYYRHTDQLNNCPASHPLRSQNSLQASRDEEKPLATSSTEGIQSFESESLTNQATCAQQSKVCLPPNNAAAGPEEEELFRLLPESTPAERRRFLNARDGDVEAAATLLRGYLDWRAQYKLDTLSSVSNDNESDLENGAWQRASAMALRYSSTETDAPSMLPCIVFFDAQGRDDDGNLVSMTEKNDGTRVLQHLPARIDTRLAPGPTYGLALALYLDQTFDRNSMEKVCVVIDARPGTGWANIPVFQLISFIKSVSKLLSDLFPERLSKCVLFPVPRMAKFAWDMVKPFLDPDTAERVCLVSGPDREDSPPPPKMREYFDEEMIQCMEQRRLSSFVVENDEPKRRTKKAILVNQPMAGYSHSKRDAAETKLSSSSVIKSDILKRRPKPSRHGIMRPEATSRTFGFDAIV